MTTAALESLLDPQEPHSCSIVAREELVVAGWTPFRAVYTALDESVLVDVALEDGATAGAGAVLGTVSGPAPSILRGERAALNLLCRLSGIATLTARFVERVSGTGVEILDTRKTTPCLRALERHAVVCGGGHNHRFDLASMAMVKDNHTGMMGSKGLGSLIGAIRSSHPPPFRIEIEVDSPEAFSRALDLAPDRILLDNMSPEELTGCTRLARRRAAGGSVYLEASGGVDLSSVRSIAETGVDGISIGMLTHSAVSSDIGMDHRTARRED